MSRNSKVNYFTDRKGGDERGRAWGAPTSLITDCDPQTLDDRKQNNTLTEQQKQSDTQGKLLNLKQLECKIRVWQPLESVFRSI